MPLPGWKYDPNDPEQAAMVERAQRDWDPRRNLGPSLYQGVGGLARGAATTAVGWPGDLERFAAPGEPSYVFPSSEQVSHALPRFGVEKDNPMEQIGSFIPITPGQIGKGAAMIGKGATKLGGTLLERLGQLAPELRPQAALADSLRGPGAAEAGMSRLGMLGTLAGLGGVGTLLARAYAKPKKEAPKAPPPPAEEENQATRALNKKIEDAGG